MNADEWQDHPGSNETGRLVSVAEAAHLLDVSESTIWRWIRAGIIPAYRIGPKRVRLSVEDVRATASPLRSSGLPELTEEEAAELLKANQAAREFQDELLGQRGGKLFPSSVDIIHEMRDQRTTEIS